jgi:hypothetical protein
MAIVETTTRTIPTDDPADAPDVVKLYNEAKANGTLFRVANKGKSEYLNPKHVVGVTDGTDD